MIFLIFWAFWMVGEARAASCCGSAATFPSLLTGDERARLSAGLHYGEYIGDVDRSGRAVFRSTSDTESYQTLQLDGAHLLSDRWQLGLSIPLTRKKIKTEIFSASDFGVGDSSLTVGYEAWPRFTAKDWLHGYLFLQMTFPTGGSIYEAREVFGVDSHGRGFYVPALGTLLKTESGAWDFLYRGLLARAVPRAIKNQAFTLQPGFWLQNSLGAGYSFGQGYRVGSMVNWQWEAGTRKVGVGSSTTAAVSLWTLSASVAKMWSENFSTSLAYADQTLLGPARTTALARSVSLDFSYAWLR